MNTFTLIVNLLSLIAVSRKKIVQLHLQKPFVYVISYFTYRLLMNIYYHQANPEYGVVFTSDVLVLLWYSVIWSKAEKAYGSNYDYTQNLELEFQKKKKTKFLKAFKSGSVKVRIKRTK